MKKNILVTATGGRSVGSGLLHALLRTSADVRDRWNVVAADADSFAWGLYVAPASTLLPPASSPAYLESLLQVINKYKIDAILPGSEPETNLLSAMPDLLPVPAITNRNELMPLMTDKFRMIEKLKELGLPVIETFPISEWETALSKYDFPFVVKPTRGTGGSKGLHFVFEKSELVQLLPGLADHHHYCIQPYIGTGEDEYTVGVLSDKNGSLIDTIIMKRKLMGLSLLHSRQHKEKNYAISTGYSQGYFVRDERIRGFCETLAAQLKSCGPLNIQLRVSGNAIYVFEIHPRFSGTSPMRAEVGFNEPDILLRNTLFNETFGRLNYRNEVAVIRAFEHVVVPIQDMK
ncbi:MAG: ATP-grasp domain-containing protein [Bacteroidia bacterium]